MRRSRRRGRSGPKRPRQRPPGGWNERPEAPPGHSPLPDLPTLPSSLRWLLRLEPGHHLAQPLAGGFDGVVEVGLVQALEVLHAALVLGAPLAGELAAGDFGQDLLHFLLGLVVHDPRAAGEVAV